MGDDGFNSSYRCNRLGIREPGPIFGRSLILRLFYIGRGRRGDNERVAHISDPSYVSVKIGGGGGREFNIFVGMESSLDRDKTSWWRERKRGVFAVEESR